MNQQAREKMIEAREIVKEASALLDRSAVHCEGCQRDNFKNWSEAQAGKELDSIVNKLTKWINKKD